MTNKIPPVAECIRNVSSWSHVSPQHKLDGVRFNLREFNEILPIASPKMEALFQKIKELDEEDMRTSGHHFKHLIYTDVKGAYGAKLLAAGFKAKGYKMAFDENFKIHENGKEQFALLCSSLLYGKPVGVRFRKQLMTLMNARPENTFGERIRFLILDQGYKEGLDVFDIKYVHLFEPLITKADEKQVVGRGTRFCGQSGLPFDAKRGWPLYVFRYDLTLPEELQTTLESETAFDYFLKNTHLNLESLVLAAELETYCQEGAVDAELTEPIHKFMLPGQIEHKTSVVLPPKPDTLSMVSPPKRFVRRYGKVFDTNKPIICAKGCSGNVSPIPTPLILLAYLVAYPTATHVMKTANVRSMLCAKLPKSSLFCSYLGQVWKNPDDFFEEHKEVLKSIVENKELLAIHRRTIKSFIKYFRTVRSKAQDTITTPMDFWEARNFIKNHFKEYKWAGVEIKNECGTKEEVGPKKELVSFTPTQNFVRKYFTPELAYKGMLAYHSVGSGKSCTGIATASSSFESAGYTIIWVTRHTLKDDLWKNMFDQVCDLILRDKIEKGLKIPKDRGARLKLVSKQWLMPMSYKQFANMLEGRNEFYHKLVERNGKEDPLRKTFVVIDEIHKLYTPDLKAQERPNVEKLKTLIHNSYTLSKKDSVRLLLMTATPILDDPTSLIRILNFIRLPDQQLTEDLGEFMKEYCDTNGYFTEEGGQRFLNEIVGMISYLNRSEDIRQFAYPVFENVLVPLSSSVVKKPNIEIQELQDRMGECPPKDKKCVSGLKREIRDLERGYKQAMKEDISQEKAFMDCLKK